jgi:hypothetical protein
MPACNLLIQGGSLKTPGLRLSFNLNRLKNILQPGVSWSRRPGTVLLTTKMAIEIWLDTAVQVGLALSAGHLKRLSENSGWHRGDRFEKERA